MKKNVCILMAGVFIVTVCTMFSGPAVYGALAGTKHDFTAQAWSGGQICLPCHTPHNAVAVANAPLWNHQQSAVAAYTLYASSTLNAVVAQPSGYTKLCLSCHDGTIALENFGTVTTGTTFATGVALLGTNLGNDHPVSFTYNTALATADGSLKDPSVALSGLGGTIAANLLEGGTTVSCSSCHDVHNKYSVAKLLKKSNAGSALCQTCHSK